MSGVDFPDVAAPKLAQALMQAQRVTGTHTNKNMLGLC